MMEVERFICKLRSGALPLTKKTQAQRAKEQRRRSRLGDGDYQEVVKAEVICIGGGREPTHAGERRTRHGRIRSGVDARHRGANGTRGVPVGPSPTGLAVNQDTPPRVDVRAKAEWEGTEGVPNAAAVGFLEEQRICRAGKPEPVSIDVAGLDIRMRSKPLPELTSALLPLANTCQSVGESPSNENEVRMVLVEATAFV